MQTFLQRARMKWFVATNTLGYTSDYLEQVYKIYLNHTKVIHWRDGYPVYSPATPAAFSKPAANFFARQLYRSITNKNAPNMFSFAVNDTCNAACKHCSFFEGVDDKSRDVLTTKQAIGAIKDAQEMGVSVINIVGGEPTLRKDLPELLRSVDKDLSTVMMFTNGSLLEEQAHILRKAGLDSVYVSIDRPDAKRHDRFRAKPGLFEDAMRGIEAAKRAGLTTAMSCTITPKMFANGEMDKLIELGKKEGVHEVFLVDAMPTGRYKDYEELVDNPDWVEEMIKATEKYNQDPSYPGILAWAYSTSHRSVGCSCGTNYFYLSPYGDIMSCDFNHAAFGNIFEKPMWKIWDELTSRKDFEHSKWGGCKVKDSEWRAKDTVSAEAKSGCGSC